MPNGLKLRTTLSGHTSFIQRIAWSSDGDRLASASKDGKVLIWEPNVVKTPTIKELHPIKELQRNNESVYCVEWRTQDNNIVASGSKDNTVQIWDINSGRYTLLEGHNGPVYSLAWSPDGSLLASGGVDGTIRLWDTASWRLFKQPIVGHRGNIISLAWSRDGRLLASGSADNTIRLWDTNNWIEAERFQGHHDLVSSVIWSPDGQFLATASIDATISFWGGNKFDRTHIIEGHVGGITSISCSACGRFIASKARDGTVRIWREERTSGSVFWEQVSALTEPNQPWGIPGICFHPREPNTLATLGKSFLNSGFINDTSIRIWDMDVNYLLNTKPLYNSVKYSTAKILLVGNDNVGKSCLAYRLINGSFKPQPSTHGQQAHILKSLSLIRPTQKICEAVLWDFAGQPDYRIIHALFLDDATFALVLFNPTDTFEPLRGVDFWLQSLAYRKGGSCPSILVATKIDRGGPTITEQEIEDFCRIRGITGGYVATSAETGKGIDELLRLMQKQLNWDNLTTNTTTSVFQSIKNFVHKLKELYIECKDHDILLDKSDFINKLSDEYPNKQFDIDEIIGNLKYLEIHNHIRVLQTVDSNEKILLMPELLNNLAASFVLTARSDPQGLGSLEEHRVIHNEYDFKELVSLKTEDQNILLDGAISLLVEKNICYRKSLGSNSYLVFPELINQKKPKTAETFNEEEGPTYFISGSVENVYASLVVLLGYTNTFKHHYHWKNEVQYQAQFVITEPIDKREIICGFRQSSESEGEIKLVLYYSSYTTPNIRNLFQNLVEYFLNQNIVTIKRYLPQKCSVCSSFLSRDEIIKRLNSNTDFIHCSNCGQKNTLSPIEKLYFGIDPEWSYDTSRFMAELRTKYETALVYIKALIRDEQIKTIPECFISYARGEPLNEKWVDGLANDLQKADIQIIYDRWDSWKVGTDISRFISRIEKCGFVIVVGTPLYRVKYENIQPSGTVLANEVNLINRRMNGGNEEKETVLPILRQGNEDQVFPPLLRGRLYADFRKPKEYFINLFDLILTLYSISPRRPGITELRETLRLR